MEETPMTLVSIGVVHSSYVDPAATPVQSAINMDEFATIEIHDEYVEALEGLAEFDYLWLMTWLLGSRSRKPVALRQVPFLLQYEQRSMGVLATRGPRRINPVGLSLVKLVRIEGNLIHFGGVDIVNGTAVVDVKPYVAQFDRPDGDIRSGWFDELDIVEGLTPAQLALRPPDLKS